jgi:hypothetical protein
LQTLLAGLIMDWEISEKSSAQCENRYYGRNAIDDKTLTNGKEKI